MPPNCVKIYRTIFISLTLFKCTNSVALSTFTCYVTIALICTQNVFHHHSVETLHPLTLTPSPTPRPHHPPFCLLSL